VYFVYDFNINNSHSASTVNNVVSYKFLYYYYFFNPRKNEGGKILRKSIKRFEVLLLLLLLTLQADWVSYGFSSGG